MKMIKLTTKNGDDVLINSNRISRVIPCTFLVLTGNTQDVKTFFGNKTVYLLKRIYGSEIRLDARSVWEVRESLQEVLRMCNE